MPCPDDDGILDPDDLWRRITPDWVIRDKNDGRIRPSSAAFKAPSCSVLLAREDTRDRALLDWAGFSLTAVTAAEARRLEQAVCRDPTPEDPPHCLIEGDKKKRTAATGEKPAEQLALGARWVGAVPTPTGE